VFGAATRSRLRQPSAFTLVEAVLAITLTMILTAAAIGGLVGVQAWRGSSAVRRFEGELLYAHSAALLSTRRVMCVLSNGTSYALQQETTPDTGSVVSPVI
jgi:type II secretory pathway pseudopilin PulG